MTDPSLPRLAGLLVVLVAAAPAQEQEQERNILSPFRSPDQHYPPPDAVYEQLRIMKAIAGGRGRDQVRFDEQGREVCDHEGWQRAHERLGELMEPGYAGYLAQIMRRSRSAEDRDIAFYGGFYAENPADVMNLISHIPGEPRRPIREDALHRAIPYLRVHLPRRFGDLTQEQKDALLEGRPEPGSPAAKARGIVRDPRDEDFLYSLNLRPFIELLKLDDPLDRAQAAWFLEQVAGIRRPLARDWLRPHVRVLRSGVLAGDEAVRKHVRGLIAALDEDGGEPPGPDAGEDEVRAWARKAIEKAFPPIFRVSEGLFVLYPGMERERLWRAGAGLLRRDGLGSFTSGKLPGGEPYRGLRVVRVPPPLDSLGIPRGAVLTAVNGEPVRNEELLLAFFEKHLEGGIRSFIVEFVAHDARRAIEYRIRD